MKIILKQDVPGLGYKDEIHTVKDGYGRNYLLPQRFAVLATDKAVKALNEELKQRAHKIAKIKADAEEAAKAYEGITLQIEARVADGQTIYGSVGPAQIVAALAEKGIELDTKKVLTKGVKVLGQHTALIQLLLSARPTAPRMLPRLKKLKQRKPKKHQPKRLLQPRLQLKHLLLNKTNTTYINKRERKHFISSLFRL